MPQPRCHLRPAKKPDLHKLHKWRNDPWIISLSSSKRTVPLEEHRQWFTKALASSDHLLYIINEDCGLVRAERTSRNSGVISIYLLKLYSGQGLGVEALVKACQALFKEWGISKIYAYIRFNNYPSISAFTKAGFSETTTEKSCPDDHHCYIYSKG